jgi:hypothetical protein
MIKNKKVIEEPALVFHYSLKNDVILVFQSYLSKIENYAMEYFYLKKLDLVDILLKRIIHLKELLPLRPEIKDNLTNLLIKLESKFKEMVGNEKRNFISSVKSCYALTKL